MAKNRNRRRPFSDEPRARMPAPPSESILADESVRGMFGFFREVGVRETIESFVVAIILALLFRAFEAEAFIIPTGSMAPSLNGQHLDLECENCGLRYHSGASSESDSAETFEAIHSTYCPICRYQTVLTRSTDPGGLDPDHVSNNGDRILVNKFIYDFSEPERFDVIVFKNPNNGKQNYIKRLIGLPGDNVLIENGDIYLMDRRDDGTWDRHISRKPPAKLKHVLQTVDDTDYIGRFLKSVKWPSRWQDFRNDGGWKQDNQDVHPVFSSQGQSESWLRYRHFQPLKQDWSTIEDGSLPLRYRDGNLPTGELIGDQYGYNDSLVRARVDGFGNVDPNTYQNLGLHWVGDIGLECWSEIKSDSGKLLLDIVEGGAHFTCAIDVATGSASLSCDDSGVDTKVTFRDASGKAVESPRAQTAVKGPGSYHFLYVNADDQLHLWINNRYVEFDAAQFDRPGVPLPTYSVGDPGDAEPLGVGAASGLDIQVDRLRVVRDIYYTSAKGQTVFTGTRGVISNLNNEAQWADENLVLQFHRNPELWGTPEAISIYQAKKGATEPMFQLERGATRDKDQFLPMGDNSPHSLDGRVWAGPHYVERDMLIGRALFVYWPHTLNRPIKYFPNFGEMGFIR